MNKEKVSKVKLENADGLSFGTLYDANKMLMEQENKLSVTKIREAKDKLEKYILKTNNNYYMLLCHERRDYTIFRTDKTLNNIGLNISILIDEVANTRGVIKDIDLTEDKNAFEFWISIDGESFCYMFFPCDPCVIDEVG